MHSHPQSRPDSNASSKRAGKTRVDRQLLDNPGWRPHPVETEIQVISRLRRELEETQNRLAAFHEQAPIGYVKLDQYGHIHDVNAVAAQLLGFEREKLSHLPFNLLVYRGDAARCLSHLSQCRKAESHRVVTELRLQARNLQLHPVQLVSVPFAEGGRRMYLTALVDLTEYRNGAATLARAKEFSESIVETIREPLAVLDGDLKIVSVNGAFARYFERDAGLVKGRFLEVLMNLWWSGNQLRGELEKVLIKNMPLEDFQMEINPPGMGKRILLLNARRLYQKESVPSYLLVALEDITARKNAEEELQKANQDLEKRVHERTVALEKSYQQMEAFCYSIAHDLRQPLRGMASFSYHLALEYGPKLDEQGRDYARRIQKSAERMDRLIQDLLSYGQLNTMPVALAEVNLESVFHEVLANCQVEIENSRAIIRKKKPLPIVRGHAIMLQMALTNLLSNALKFVPAGVRPKITVSAENKRSHIRVWIQDNGIGIEPEYQKIIFKVFERLHSTAAYPGTGIGLAIVSKCVERIGGSVGVESTLGQGSRFWLDLPAK